MNNPRFSILIPVVKTRFFRDAFNSANNQSFRDFEIVVLDNKADGDISDVASQPNVRIIKNEKQLPPAENWNNGISACRGEFILLLSDDDKLQPCCLHEVDNLLRKYDDDLDIIRILRGEFWSDYETVFAYSCPGCEIETLPEYIYYQLKFFRGQALSDFVFRRSAALEVGGFRSDGASMASDKILVTEIAALKNKIANLNKHLLLYRWHENNFSVRPRPTLYEEYVIADFAYYQVVKAVLGKSSGAFNELALAKNEENLQVRMNSVYGDALRQLGLLALYRLYRMTPPSSASRRRSLFSAFSGWLKKRVR